MIERQTAELAFRFDRTERNGNITVFMPPTVRLSQLDERLFKGKTSCRDSAFIDWLQYRELLPVDISTRCARSLLHA